MGVVIRLAVRVKPGSSRAGVGGEWGDDPPRLLVAVQARAVDGKANKAVVEAVAKSLGVSRTSVRIVTGSKSRSKVLEIDGATPEVVALLGELRKS